MQSRDQDGDPYCDRDAEPQVADGLSLCAGKRVPVVVFLTEDDFECGRYGDRTLSRYRQMAAELGGAACSSGITTADRLAAVTQEWDLKKVLIYDVWSTAIPPFLIPGFQMGRYEVTNAQWKHYLDKEFRTEHTTAKGETLKSLAGRYVKFRGEPVESEWKAIYALNWRTLVDGWKKMKVKPKKAGENEGEKEAGKEGDPAGEAGREAEEEEAGVPVWQPGWPVENPPADPKNTIENLELPEGLKLLVYRHRVPQHWYGWCRLSGFGVGREYCDPAKPPAEAFMVPAEEPFKSLALADQDFAAYPARSISMNEGLAFAEGAGCQFATEYEWERAARGDNLRWPYCFGTWDHDKQKTLIAGAENERSRTVFPMPPSTAEPEQSSLRFARESRARQ